MSNYVLETLYGMLFVMKRTEPVKILQKGGVIEQFEIDGHHNDVDIQRIITEDKYGRILHIYISSPVNIDNRCAVMFIDGDTNIAHLNSLNVHDNCIVEKVITDPVGMELTVKKRIGTKLIRIMVQICEKEKVKRIELTDNSYVTCDGGGTMQLKYLHTLTQGVPWYYKFGFVPIDDKNKEIMEYNYNKMRNYVTNELNIKDILKNSVNIRVEEIPKAREIIRIFDDNRNEKLYDTIQKVTKNSRYCNVFSKIFEEVYCGLKLKKYNGSLKMILKVSISNTLK